MSRRFFAVTSMPDVLFVEDFAQATFLKAIVQRLPKDHRVQIAFQTLSRARRGW